MKGSWGNAISWLRGRRTRSAGTSLRRAPSGYDGFLQRVRAEFSSPEPESEALRQLIVSLSSMTSQHLPRSKRKWLELLVDSPYLDGPLGVYADAFAEIGFQVYRPRNQGAIVNALTASSLPAGKAKFVLVDDLIASKDLVPVKPDFPLNKILTSNIRRWSGRRLRKMTMIHYAAVGESFWRLGRTNPSAMPDEALTLVPTEVLQTPRPGQDPNYRLAGFAGAVDPSEIFEWSRPDPRKIYGRGRGIVQALGDEVEGSEFMSRMVGVFARNHNVPASALFYRGEKDPLEMERHFDRKHRGLGRLFRMAFHRVSSESIGPVRDSFSIERLGDPIDPAKTSEYSRFIWEFIRQHLRIPPSMLANYDDNSGLGMSGIELERFIFLATVMTPLVLDFEETLQDLARHEFDERLVVRHLPFVDTDREFRLRVAEKCPWILTNDQTLALGGWPALEDKAAGSAHVMPRGKIIIESLAPGNEDLLRIASARGRQGDGDEGDDSSSANALPVGSNGGGNCFHVKRVKQLASGLGDVEQQLARIEQQIAEVRLR